MRLKDGKLKDVLNTKTGRVIQSVVIGGIKGIPLLGNVITELKDNQADELSEKGDVNITRAVSYCFVGVLMLGRIAWPEHVNPELIDIILSNF